MRLPLQKRVQSGRAGVWDAVTGAGAPVAALDLAACEHNIAEMRSRARGLPIQLASKSIRVRGLIDRVLAEPGYRGVLAYSAAEARWLAERGVQVQPSYVTDVARRDSTRREQVPASIEADRGLRLAR